MYRQANSGHLYGCWDRNMRLRSYAALELERGTRINAVPVADPVIAQIRRTALMSHGSSLASQLRPSLFCCREIHCVSGICSW